MGRWRKASSIQIRSSGDNPYCSSPGRIALYGDTGEKSTHKSPTASSVATLKSGLPLPQFTPAPPILRRDAFDHDDYILELKMDGFRALAYVGEDQTRLVSRNGNAFKRFTELACAIHIDLDCQAVLDDEIVILDDEGRPQFYELLRRRGRGEPAFYAFDVLWLDGEDLRERPLVERKALLRKLVPKQPCILLYADHIERNGTEFFRLTCDRDLEGIFADGIDIRQEPEGY